MLTADTFVRAGRLAAGSGTWGAVGRTLTGPRGRVVTMQIALLGAFVALWEGAVAAGFIETFVYGRPSEMFAFVGGGLVDGSLWRHAGVTLMAQVLGLLVGTVVGTVIGLALWWSPFWSRVFEPYAVILNATPKIVIAPLLIMWFGLGIESKVMIAVLISFVVAWLGAFEGARSADPDQQDLIRAFGGNKWALFAKVVTPSAMPHILATLRMNVGLSLIGVITGEFLSSTAGLGYLVDSTAKAYKMSHTLGAILAIAVIAAMQLWAISRLERKLTSWL